MVLLCALVLSASAGKAHAPRSIAIPTSRPISRSVLTRRPPLVCSLNRTLQPVRFHNKPLALRALGLLAPLARGVAEIAALLLRGAGVPEPERTGGARPH